MKRIGSDAELTARIADDLAGRGAGLPAEQGARIEQALCAAMRAEVMIEQRNSPWPLFAEMTGGNEA